MATNTHQKRENYRALGIAFGIPLGIPISLALGNIAYGPIIGIVLGILFGQVLETINKRKLENVNTSNDRRALKRYMFWVTLGILILSVVIIEYIYLMIQ